MLASNLPSIKKAALNREKRQIEQQQKDILAAERRSRQEEADKQNETRNEIEKELKNIHSERSDCNIDITRAKKTHQVFERRNN